LEVDPRQSDGIDTFILDQMSDQGVKGVLKTKDP